MEYCEKHSGMIHTKEMCLVCNLQAELEAVRKLLGRWLAGEESVGCKCTICNDTRKFLKGR